MDLIGRTQMRKSIIKKGVMGAALLFSITSNASLIEHNGYELNTDTNIVTDGELEWLQWDETIGQSVGDALINYSALGWRIANNDEMAGLLNSFNFGLTFDSQENREQIVFQQFTTDENSEANAFISLFGDTRIASGKPAFTSTDPFARTMALFGSDEDGDGFRQNAYIADDYISNSGTESVGRVKLERDLYRASFSFDDYGVALVRGVSTVPEPGSLALLGLGLAALSFSRRKSSID